jgi:hypothetical protein
LSSVELTPVVTAGGIWRVKISWPVHGPRFFGRFNTEAEAEKWIAEHHWLTEQHPEPDLPHADDPEAPNDR